MKHTPFNWNPKGYNALKQSEPVKRLVNAEAARVAAQANSMAVVDSARYLAEPARNTPNGCIALMTTGTLDSNTTFHETAYDNLKYNTLKKAAGV